MKIKMAVIDDDNGITSMVKDAFSSPDFQVEYANTGKEGIRMVEELNPDILLLDIQLPDMTGWEICEKLRGHRAYKRIPVIMMSGQFGQAEDKAKGLQIGADDYVDKPFSLSVLR